MRQARGSDVLHRAIAGELAGGTGMVIRHAERKAIADSLNSDGTELTRKGITAATRLGRALGKTSDAHVYHSPIERCRMTAEHISAALRTRGVIVLMEEASVLGSTYLVSKNAALALADNVGSNAFIRMWLNSEIPESLVHPAAQAVHAHLQFLDKTLPDPADDTTAIYVTHDWNIALMREVLLGTTHEQAGWPGFLDGLLANRFEHGLVVEACGRRAEIDVRDFPSRA